MALLHVCMDVSDAESIADWYTSNLDFERSWQFTASGERSIFVADDSGVEIQLRETDGETTFEFGTGWDHVAVEVEDVDDSIGRIDHDGVVEAPSGGPDSGARTAFVADPDGHTIELIQLYE